MLFESRAKKDFRSYFEMLRDQMHLPIVDVSHDADEVTRLATTHLQLKQGHVQSS
ncbi:hypothetical protein N9K86_01545 [Litoricolaceae bacterium]|nr:hypothetical protein [Litorivicinaceae bacterium]MDB2401964.1 hypothetical protein [Litorivicinaceae bacterium]